MVCDYCVRTTLTNTTCRSCCRRQLVNGGARAATIVTAIVDTVEYIAPEQTRSQPFDPGADVFPFGLRGGR